MRSTSPRCCLLTRLRPHSWRCRCRLAAPPPGTGATLPNLIQTASINPSSAVARPPSPKPMLQRRHRLLAAPPRFPLHCHAAASHGLPLSLGAPVTPLLTRRNLTRPKRRKVEGLHRLGEYSVADDVAADEEGNAYVTDVRGSKIWKVSPDGKLLSVIKNATFSQRAGTLNNLIGLNGIAYHPNGYLLVVHTSGGDLFKVDPRTGTVSVVAGVRGSLKRGDGLELLSPTKLAVAGMPSRLVESSDDWETAAVTGRYVGPLHRVASSATVKDGDVYVNHIVGFGLGKKKTHVIAKAVFAPL